MREERKKEVGHRDKMAQKNGEKGGELRLVSRNPSRSRGGEESVCKGIPKNRGARAP